MTWRRWLIKRSQKLVVGEHICLLFTEGIMLISTVQFYSWSLSLIKFISRSKLWSSLTHFSVPILKLILIPVQVENDAIFCFDIEKRFCSNVTCLNIWHFCTQCFFLLSVLGLLVCVLLFWCYISFVATCHSYHFCSNGCCHQPLVL
jgi:hypothetical protein